MNAVEQRVELGVVSSPGREPTFFAIVANEHRVQLCSALKEVRLKQAKEVRQLLAQLTLLLLHYEQDQANAIVDQGELFLQGFKKREQIEARMIKAGERVDDRELVADRHVDNALLIGIIHSGLEGIVSDQAQRRVPVNETIAES